LKKDESNHTKISIKLIVTEQFVGTTGLTEIFTDIILSEIKEKVWILEPESDIMGLPTIPNQVVPEEGS